MRPSAPEPPDPGGGPALRLTAVLSLSFSVLGPPPPRRRCQPVPSLVIRSPVLLPPPPPRAANKPIGPASCSHFGDAEWMCLGLGHKVHHGRVLRGAGGARTCPPALLGKRGLSEGEAPLTLGGRSRKEVADRPAPAAPSSQQKKMGKLRVHHLYFPFLTPEANKGKHVAGDNYVQQPHTPRHPPGPGKCPLSPSPRFLFNWRLFPRTQVFPKTLQIPKDQQGAPSPAGSDAAAEGWAGEGPEDCLACSLSRLPALLGA